MDTSKGKSRGPPNDAPGSSADSIPSSSSNATLPNRILQSASSLLSSASTPSSSLLPTLSANGKPSSSSSSSAVHGRALAAADAHQTLGGSTSGSSAQPQASTFRSGGVIARGSNGTDEDFGRFAGGDIPERTVGNTGLDYDRYTYTQQEVQSPDDASSATASRAVDFSSRHYGAEDLLPRPEDGAGVLALLSEDAEARDVDGEEGEEHRELDERRHQTWQYELDSTVPPSRTYGNGSTSTSTGTGTDGLIVSERTNPYLHSLASSTSDGTGDGDGDGGEVLAFLRANEYTDDVYGLPRVVREALDEVKEEEQTEEARTRAVRRLEALCRHIRGAGAGSGTGEVRVEQGELERIWGRRIGMDHS